MAISSELLSVPSLPITNEELNVFRLSTNFSEAEKRQKIEQAIGYQIEAIGHLINYGSGLDIILAELAQKYESQLGGEYYEIKRDLNQLIELIKKEIQSADEYSQKFTQLLSEVN